MPGNYEICFIGGFTLHVYKIYFKKQSKKRNWDWFSDKSAPWLFIALKAITLLCLNLFFQGKKQQGQQGKESQIICACLYVVPLGKRISSSRIKDVFLIVMVVDEVVSWWQYWWLWRWWKWLAVLLAPSVKEMYQTDQHTYKWTNQLVIL